MFAQTKKVASLIELSSPQDEVRIPAVERVKLACKRQGDDPLILFLKTSCQFLKMCYNEGDYTQGVAYEKALRTHFRGFHLARRYLF